MGGITVRPLRAGEDARWHDVGPAAEDGGDRERRWLSERAGKDPRCFLLAERDGAAIARLRGGFSKATASLYLVFAHAARASQDLAATALAFAAYLHQALPTDDAQVMIWEKPGSPDLQAAMAGAGFALDRTKVFVERALVDPMPPVVARFTYRSLAEAGEQLFVETMTEAATGDPFEEVSERDPAGDFQELVEYAGDKFDPTAWRIARVEGQPVGVVLPQPYPGSPGEGTIFYLGVLPGFRGRGHGRALHAAGLAFLAAAGITDYVGSTDVRNVPMIRVFDANGCTQTGSQWFYARTSSLRAT